MLTFSDLIFSKAFDKGSSWAFATVGAAEGINYIAIGLGYANRSNFDKKNGKETEKVKPTNTDHKVTLNKVQLNLIKFNSSADIVKSIHEADVLLWGFDCFVFSWVAASLDDFSFVPVFSFVVAVAVLDLFGYVAPTLGWQTPDSTSNVIIEDVALVAGLKHNLISLSQIYDRGYHVNFYEEHCEIVSRSDIMIAMTSVKHGSLYESRVSTNTDGSEKAKQRKTSFKIKTESSILELCHLLHIDLFGPFNVISISKKRVVVRKNRTLIEAARTMLEEARFPTYFWAEAVQTACFTQNATLINKHRKTPFEMLNSDILTNPDPANPDTVDPDITLNSDDPHVSGNSANTEAHVEGEQHDSHQESSTE
ncbi:hypothetical protein AgCh_031274 [Apium graveolens]